MSEVAACLALPVPWEFRGETFKVAGVDYELEGMFSYWVEDNALKFILRHRETLGAAGVALQMEGWRHDGASGQYDWDEVHCWNARHSLEGRKHLLAMRLAKGGVPGTRVEDMRCVVEEAWEDASPGGARERLLAAAERADSDPNLARRYPRRRAAAG